MSDKLKYIVDFTYNLLNYLYKLEVPVTDFPNECRNLREEDDMFNPPELYLCQRYFVTMWFKPIVFYENI